MSLPELIEIIPLPQPVQAEITVPGSKSITNRALILAALADGEVTLTGALWSEDTQVMTEALRVLGFELQVENDPLEFCNRTITVKGQGGRIPKAGTAAQPLELFVSNAGTAARFLAAMVCLGTGVYRLSGVARMHERPQAALFKALRELGYRVDSPNDKLPVTIYGEGRKESECHVSVAESSQFASALALAAIWGGWKVILDGTNSEEQPYVAMTNQLVNRFPLTGGIFEIEPDASSASYFYGAGSLCSGVHVPSRSFSGWQIDNDFPDYLLESPREISRKSDLGDSIMTAIVLAPFAQSETRFVHLGRLRVQECERVVALRTELTRCGAKVVEEGDTLTVYPAQLHGAEIETYNDHRMAMCFAILGLKVPGIRLKNPACVKKTFPNFFQKLATAPPQGLGVEIWQVEAGKRIRRLSGEDLFAD